MDEGKGRRPFGRRARLRSVAIGGIVGAAGAIATVRRLRRSSAQLHAGGLAAFEDAPCFLETRALTGDQAPREPD
jgi:hypothetical protein